MPPAMSTIGSRMAAATEDTRRDARARSSTDWRKAFCSVMRGYRSRRSVNSATATPSGSNPRSADRNCMYVAVRTQAAVPITMASATWAATKTACALPCPPERLVAPRPVSRAVRSSRVARLTGHSPVSAPAPVAIRRQKPSDHRSRRKDHRKLTLSGMMELRTERPNAPVASARMLARDRMTAISPVSCARRSRGEAPLATRIANSRSRTTPVMRKREARLVQMTRRTSPARTNSRTRFGRRSWTRRSFTVVSGNVIPSYGGGTAFR